VGPPQSSGRWVARLGPATPSRALARPLTRMLPGGSTEFGVGWVPVPLAMCPPSSRAHVYVTPPSTLQPTLFTHEFSHPAPHDFPSAAQVCFVSLGNDIQHTNPTPSGFRNSAQKRRAVAGTLLGPRFAPTANASAELSTVAVAQGGVRRIIHENTHTQQLPPVWVRVGYSLGLGLGRARANKAEVSVVRVSRRRQLCIHTPLTSSPSPSGLGPRLGLSVGFGGWAG